MSDLNDAAMGSLEAQLVDLYRANEFLTTELGVSGADDLIAMVESLRTQVGELMHAQAVANLEAQLCDLYAQRERIEKAIGVSDPHAIVRLVRSMEAQLVEFYKTRDARAVA
jgi:hypothetical protein